MEGGSRTQARDGHVPSMKLTVTGGAEAKAKWSPLKCPARDTVALAGTALVWVALGSFQGPRGGTRSLALSLGPVARQPCGLG